MAKLRAAKKKYVAAPSFTADPQHVTELVRVRDLRDLVLWVLCEGTLAPRWLRIVNHKAIPKIISVLVPGLPLFKGEGPQPKPVDCPELPCLGEEFDLAWPVWAPTAVLGSNSAKREFTTIPLRSKEKKKRNLQSASVPVTDLVLSEDQLLNCDYPLEVQEGWVSLNTLDHPQRVLAVDCEMCDAAGQQVLTRVSVVDEKETLIYETYVKPKETITNYLTPFSGITAEILKDVSTTREDVQQWFLQNVSSHDILIGHSLECDLKAMHIVHSTVIDTSVIFPHVRGLPYRLSLRFLAERYLGLTIQAGKDGHDSKEDASTCMKLVQKKMERGLLYGTDEVMSLSTKLSESQLTSATVDYTASAGAAGSLQSIVSVSSDGEAAQKISSLSRSHTFVFGHLHELEDAIEAGIALESVYEELNKNLALIVRTAEPNTGIIIWTGHGSTKDLRLLREKAKAGPLSESEREELKQAGTRARMGISYLKVTRAKTTEAPLKRLTESPTPDNNKTRKLE